MLLSCSLSDGYFYVVGLSPQLERWGGGEKKE